MRAALLATVLAACGGGQQTPPPPVANVAPREPADAAVDAAPTGTAALMAKMIQFKDDICKCSDKACADRVIEQMTKWAQEMAKSGGEDSPRISDADTKQMAAVTEELATCMTRVMVPGAGSGSAP